MLQGQTYLVNILSIIHFSGTNLAVRKLPEISNDHALSCMLYVWNILMQLLHRLLLSPYQIVHPLHSYICRSLNRATCRTSATFECLQQNLSIHFKPLYGTNQDAFLNEYYFHSAPFSLKNAQNNCTLL
jgi:hypothetical protein